MHTGHEGVGGNCQLLPRGNGQQGAVVADPESNALAALRTGRGGEEIADQLKLAHQVSCLTNAVPFLAASVVAILRCRSSP